MSDSNNEGSMNTDVQDELRTLTVRGVSQATGIAEWRLYELLRAGKGPPHFRVGLTYRIRVKDLEAWMQDQTNHQQEVSK
jgi:predicted DNA-binding transcriptional regulator AlpA